MKTERDRIADELVKRTEWWPDKIDVPENIEFRELVYHTPPEPDLSLTYFTRRGTDAVRPAIR